ncbi:conserved hypothetical protein [Hyella patelloides LEGE 07179]|uniref:Uncharacterized protein n=1 Tax=Hyella patelloides LEGE 07179 TaxID=945734 RepID=A0A563W2A5_9CYAN|nr:hypothetical protein [Hyella patelloides]VEP17775.1 conserved hypothetical protein [Hyella patelloides LEGE 07179]
MNKPKPNNALGDNPLASTNKGIFSKTANSEPLPQDNQERRIKKEESRIKNLENNQNIRFLNESEREKVNFRLPSELNDWLDDLIKTGKRKHGHKIPKEIWVQAALELMKELIVDCHEVTSIDELRAKLTSIVEQTNRNS